MNSMRTGTIGIQKYINWHGSIEVKTATCSIKILLIILFALNSPVKAQQPCNESTGVKDNLPVFYKNLVERQVFPLSWLQGEKGDFTIWRKEARARVMDCLLTPPPSIPFNPIIISEQDRGSYLARKIIFNITGDSRIIAFMLVPKSPGPHPTVLLLHDHGGKFDIGKEKVIEPWDEPAEKITSARNWVKECYGGRFIGDELAKKGYVCFAVDMLNWSDRGGAGGEGQQALASNLLHLGVSFAGLIAYEDMSALEFLSIQPEVDPKRIAAMGLSVGGFRTWQLAALSDHIAAGVSVCWMSTYKALMVPGNNQTRGQSAFTMLHPGLSHYLDYPDVASIACPKPMMFCCGSQDGLFPVESIKEAFGKMRKVWDSQNAGEKLVTKLYDSPHEFNLNMQNDAFLWLDKMLQ
jgi:dienelactone hydrolase